ncbi:MAG: hypothetical protein P1P85_04735 [Patescibacteria group bacterium]|nr:hypothetical protein [Patescibacteria group bacterium]
MSKQLLKDAFGWGFLLWLIGYAFGIMFFTFIPVSMIGLIITPIATILTLWVVFKKIKGDSIKYYFLIAISWLLIAVVGDYFFIVKVFNPPDGYYKFDVYLYYILVFILPLLAGWKNEKTA